MDAAEIIAALGLEPHPEGGFYRETWRHDAPRGARAAGTAIYFLLTQEGASRWHRVDAAEIWHFYAGAPLLLSVADSGRDVHDEILGVDLAAGQRPQRIVPAGAWQRARSLGPYSLVGCTVSPGFEFARFEIAPEGFEPGPGG